jgi:hypothetical protein
MAVPEERECVVSIEAMKQAFAYIEANAETRDEHEIADGLRQAIEQAEKQEPVAWVDEMEKVPDHVWEPPFRFRRFVAGSERAQDVVIEREPTIEAAARKAAKICPPSPMTVLVYAPPTAQREWVGLTDEQRGAINSEYQGVAALLMCEAKLREKNGGNHG